MSDTFVSGHVANPTPPLSEFFDTFHELLQPRYASKYFPMQGVFLAIGQKLTGHAAVGVWLSSALACAATYWMLRAWVGPIWGLVGAILMMFQFGIYGYWSQSYWGGMVATLGGAIYFGAVRRLWDQVSLRNTVYAAGALIILANSRPLEGALAAIPITILFCIHLLKQGEAPTIRIWLKLLIPTLVIFAAGLLAMGKYNQAVTGSVWIPPYVLHERQYQESPQFVFLPLRPKISYTSDWVRYLYEVYEMRLYLSQRTPLNLLITAARKLMSWWSFYFGIILSTPLILAGLAQKGWVRILQAVLAVGFVVIGIYYEPRSVVSRLSIDVLVVGQIVVLLPVFRDFWERVAIATICLVLFEQFFVKNGFPHYFAPALCLVLFIQVKALEKLWSWNTERPSQEGLVKASRAERRRAARSYKNRQTSSSLTLRPFVMLVPVMCLVSMFLRIEAKAGNWPRNGHDPDYDALPAEDWSLRRAEIEKWLEQQSGPQLVFVWYSPYHSVVSEWVYNRADIMHAHVIWARDLGTEHNRELLKLLPDRTVWLLEPDKRDPKLIPYSEVDDDMRPPSTPPRSQRAERGRDEHPE